jgi:hypothetical protein
MGVDPDDTDRSVRAGRLFQAGDDPDGGRIIARQHEGAIAITTRRGD